MAKPSYLRFSFRVWLHPRWLRGFRRLRQSISASSCENSRCPCCRHLSSRVIPVRPESLTSAAGYYTDCMFRPRGFSPPRRLTPRASREFIAPHNRPEVHCVSGPVDHFDAAEAASRGTGL